MKKTLSLAGMLTRTRTMDLSSRTEIKDLRLSCHLSCYKHK